MAIDPLTEGDAFTGATFHLGEPIDGHGGAPLEGKVLTASMSAEPAASEEAAAQRSTRGRFP